MSQVKTRFFLCALMLLGLGAGRIPAQTNADINSGLQFDFSTPGARSLGLGGAFLAVADDATAASTNPAGLVNLTVGGSELTVELRQWGYSNVFTDHGHVDGPPSGIGLDSAAGLVTGREESRTAGLSFLSFAYVLPHGWTLAVFRHQLARFEAQANPQGFFTGDAKLGPLFRVSPSRSRLDLSVEDTGVAAGYRLLLSDTWGLLAVGAGVSYYQSQISSRTERFAVGPQSDPGNRQPGGFFGVADDFADRVDNSILQQGTSADQGVNLGALWKIGAAGTWSLGAAYRQGPSLTSRAQFVYGPASGKGSGTIDPGLGGPAVLRVPDVFGLGVAWGPAEGKVRVTLDYDRVRYSQMLRRLPNVLLQEKGVFDPAEYRVADAGEFHLGVEYVFLVLDPKAVATVRLGSWYDPGHSLQFAGGNEILAARFRPAPGQVHASAGVGLVVGENFQFDVGYDHSDRFQVLSLSLVKFF